MGLKLYYNDMSGPNRSTLLTLHALGIQDNVELIYIDIFKGEQLDPEFLKKNPLHTTPTLEEGEFTLCNSHAINSYLVDKFGKNDDLYPKDIEKRAIVNQRMYFNEGILFNTLAALVCPIYFDGVKSISQELQDKQIKAYDSLELLFGNNEYIAGNHLTIADFAIYGSISHADYLVPLDPTKYPKIINLMKKLENLPYYEKVHSGTNKWIDMMKTKM